jgi:NADH:ubiquinone oxidoreductase subunit 2 (subunit N)
MLSLSNNIFYLRNFFMSTCLKFKRLVFRFFSSNFINFSYASFFLDIPALHDLSFNQIFFKVEQIKIQELTFLSEYFLITALFCLTLFALFSFDFIYYSKKPQFSSKFWFDNQIIFLLIFILICYLILVYQQFNISFLMLTSFNDTILNDSLAVVSKLIIGIFSILYLLFINKFLKDQKLNNFEYCIILFTSIFGFFLLCCVNDFLTAYLAIELQGLAFYVLASFKKSSNFSVESGVKYFVLGSLSTALFLFGITLIYGLSGSIVFTDFKDFFIWVFSLNSIFLSSEVFSNILETFQGKTALDEARELKVAIDLLTVQYAEFDDCLLEVSATNSVEEIAFFLTQSTFSDIYNILESDGRLDYHSFLMYKVYLAELLTLKEFINSMVQMTSSSEHNLTDFLAIYGSDTLGTKFENFFENSIFENSSKYDSLANVSDVTSILQFCNSGDSALKAIEQVPLGLSTVFDSNIVVVGLLITILALFFKLALAPFHLWSPDVYEGSPSSSTFFFMVLSKFGIFVLLFRLCYFSFYSFISYWQLYSILVASISIFIGAVAGLKQRKLKSLLTYSSINNMGFVLLAFSVGNFEGIQVKFFYLIIYMLASICIWSIILNLRPKKNKYSEKQNSDIGDLALLQESNSVVAQNLGITLFSLAGLPPMVGFLAKMSVFKALSSVSIFYFSVINILFSVIATFYYLRITKIIFFENILVGKLYATINTKKVFIINFLTFLLVFLFFSPTFLYFCSYKLTLFLNKSFF